MKENTWYLNILRIFAIYWVVLIQHNFSPFHKGQFWNWVDTHDNLMFPIESKFSYITIFSMPLCFFISGYVASYTKTFYKNDFKWMLNVKLKRLFIPCVVWGAFFCLVKEHTLNLKVFTIGYAHLWFVGYLFWFFVISGFIIKYTKIDIRYVCIVSLVITIIIQIMMIKDGIVKNFPLNYTYFLSGYCLRSRVGIISRKLIGAAFVVICFFYLEYNLVFLQTIYVLLGILLIISFMRKFNIKSSKLTELLNTTSYGVYIFHLIILWFIYNLIINVFSLNEWMVLNGWYVSTILAGLTIPLSISITIVLRKAGVKYLV